VKKHLNFKDERLEITGLSEFEFNTIVRKLTKDDTPVFNSPEEGVIHTYLGLAPHLFPDERWDLFPNRDYDVDFDPNQLRLGLREYQESGVLKTLMLGGGLVQVATGGGKTLMEWATIQHLITEDPEIRGTLVVPDGNLLRQQYEDAESYGFDMSTVGRVGDGHKEFNKQITIVVSNSGINAMKRENILWDKMKLDSFLIVDEAHQIRGNQYRKFYRSHPAPMKICYTATPFSQPDDIYSNPGDCVVQGLARSVVHKIDTKFLVSKGFNSKSYVFFKKMPWRRSNTNMPWNKVEDKFVIEFETRNHYMVEAAKKAISWEIPTLLLVNKHKHAERILRELKDFNVLCKMGSSDAMVVDEFGTIEKIKIDDEWQDRFQSGIYDLLIGTPALFTGVNLPKIGFLILGGAGKSFQQYKQKMGRGLRKKDVNELHVLDFQDTQHVFLNAQANKRRAMAEDSGSEFLEEVEFWKSLYRFSKELKKKELESE
jgi:superfamily II DNA or RNA helicase